MRSYRWTSGNRIDFLSFSCFIEQGGKNKTYGGWYAGGSCLITSPLVTGGREGDPVFLQYRAIWGPSRSIAKSASTFLPQPQAHLRTS